MTNVEQYLQAEMLSLIVPLALGYLAVRAVASGLSGAGLAAGPTVAGFANVWPLALAALGAWLFDRRDLAA